VGKKPEKKKKKRREKKKESHRGKARISWECAPEPKELKKMYSKGKKTIAEGKF